MQQYYSLEEAASKLKLSADELREMAKSKKVRAFQDRGSWRFRAQEIDELARERGLGSDAELQLGDATVAAPRPTKGGKPAPPADEDKIAIDFSLDSGGSPKPGPRSPKPGPKSPTPKKASDSDVRLVMDSNLDFQVELDSDVRLEQSPSPRPGGKKSKVKPGDSSVRLVGDKQPSDSDVKVVPAAHDSDVRPRPSKSTSDSDIRLHEAGPRPPKSDPSVVTEDIIDLDAEEASAVQPKPKPPSKKPRVTQAANPLVLPPDSPFELESDPDLNVAPPPKKGKPPGKSKGDTESSSDFELVPFDANKSPIELGSGEIPLLDDEEVSLGELGPKAGNSGINLRDPADSGISLEGGGSDDEIEFELSLDSGMTPKPAKGKSPAKKVDDDSSSEFELSLDDDSPSDPSSSEFELSLDDSGDSISLADDSSSSSQFELTLDEDGGLGVDDDGKDIFEPTNFDVPALDDESGSEAVAIDEADTDLDNSSDFEISLDGDDGDSGSQVVALDGEDEADTGAATVARPRTAGGKPGKSKPKMARGSVEVDDEPDLDLDLDNSSPKKKPKKVAVVEDDEDEDSDEALASAPAAPAQWGPLPAMILLPTCLVLFLVGLMGFELVQGMFSYNRASKPNKMLIDYIGREVAKAMDAPLPND